MNVKLVSVTEPCAELKAQGIKTAEDLIVYCARVSNPSNQLNTATAPKLIRYLIKNKHWSPTEHASMSVEIKTSRAIAAQILRHRSFTYQEFSQRYAEVVDMEPVQIRKQAEKNRQSSAEEFNPIIDHGEHDASMGGPAPIYADYAIEEHLREGQRLYKQLIAAGVAKECARMVLPLTTQTTIYMTGTIRSWCTYFQIRCDEHTQKEHRDIANAIRDIFKEHFPETSTALDL